MNHVGGQISINKIQKTLIAAFILALFNFAVNVGLKYKGLFMDDLSTWGIYLESGFWGYIWNTNAYKFRPVANLIMGIGFMLSGDHTEWLFWYGLFINLIAAMVIWYIVAKLLDDEKSYIAPIVAGIIYLSSRFAYYAVGQYFGVMETVSLIFAALTLYYSLTFLNKSFLGEISYKSLICATITSMLAVFSHERFICLFAVVAFSIVLANNLTLKMRGGGILVEVALMLAVLLIRQILFSGQAWAGTGGTNMLDTLDIWQIFVFFICGFLYFFGVNAGPAYLNGYDWHTVPVPIYLLNVLVVIIVVGIVVVALYLGRNSKGWIILKQILLAGVFICATLIVGCTTIRQEMRWLYVPYIGCIILIFLCIMQIKRKRTEINNVVSLIVKSSAVILTGTVIFVELFFRSGFGNIYFWDSQRLYDSLYEKTVQAYGDDLYSRTVAIVTNEHDSFTEETMNSFYSAYSKAMNTSEVPEVVILQDINELTNEVIDKAPITIWLSRTADSLKYNSYVVDISPINNSFYSVGNTIRSAILQEGFYGWEGGNRDFIWMAQKGSLMIRSGSDGILTITGSLPEFNIPNHLSVLFNGTQIAGIEITECNFKFSIPVDIMPNTEGELTLELQKANVPYEMGVGEDRRIIGMCIGELVLD